MQVSEVMSTGVKLVSPEDSLETVIQLMKEGNCGSIPVGADDRLRGMVTDRDIALRTIGEGKDPKSCKVSDVMSEGIYYCYDDESLEEVSQKMIERKARRLAVLNRNKRMVGIVSLSDLANGDSGSDFVKEALKKITH